MPAMNEHFPEDIALFKQRLAEQQAKQVSHKREVCYL